MLSIISYLDIESVCHVDVAVTNTTERVIWLTILSANYFVIFSEHEHCEESIRWLVKRGIRLESLKVRYRAGETEIINVSTILDLDISSLRYINLKGTSIGDEGVLLIADGCPELAEISLSGCRRVTDASIIALGKSCHQLISIDLEIGRAHV